MKLLFVENRYTTALWNAVAHALQQDGDLEIHWLVQNHGYRPSAGAAHVIPYPTRRDLSGVHDAEFDRVARMDRQRTYYGYSVSHYQYYWTSIKSVLDAVQPRICFGEVSLFHELMVCQQCKSREILYLHPLSSRYPTGRFSFYTYDTLRPFLGSESTLADQELALVASAIVSRAVTPDYMKSAPASFFRRMRSHLADRTRTLSNYLQGERFNTPSPIAKYRKEYRTKKSRQAWERIAGQRRGVALSGLSILYPLQLQPENTLDVLANDHRDQTRLVRKISEKLRPDDRLYIKPNPKSHYELNDELVDLVRRNRQLIPIPHSVTMKQVLPAADLVVTVNGTVSIEAILSGVPVAVLSDYVDLLTEQNNAVRSFDELQGVIEQVRSGTFELFSETGKQRLLARLIATSYPGVISDTRHDRTCLSASNVQSIARAFRDVMRRGLTESNAAH